MATLDELVLSGAFSTGGAGASSPPRSHESGSSSPRSKWPNQEYSDEEAHSSHEEAAQPHESIGMGPGRTGVKGVIRDRAEAAAMERAKRSMEISALNRKLEQTSLAAGGRTWEEDENDRRAREGLDPISEGRNARANPVKKFGYLREVGTANYVSAVEDPEAKVVVHIYDPSLERCHDLDGSLSKLARTSSSTKFIRVKATAIGFALKKATETGALGPSSTRSNKLRGDQERFIVSEDADFLDEEYYDGAEEEEEAEADTDMLPTMLVYEKGELLHTWVRVDWEAGKDGIENFLFKNNIISRRSQLGAQGTAALSDDEEEEDNWF